MTNINRWLVPLPLNSSQEKDYQICRRKFSSLLDLPLQIYCLPNDVLTDQTNLTLINRNPLKMYWHRNLTELRLFLKLSHEQLQANLIEIHKRKRSQIRRFSKQEISPSAILLTFSQIPSTNHHLLSLTLSGKDGILELQIPSMETDLFYRGNYRKMEEDAQMRTVTALFNCTITIDYNLASLLNEYDLCRVNSEENNFSRKETKTN